MPNMAICGGQTNLNTPQQTQTMIELSDPVDSKLISVRLSREAGIYQKISQTRRNTNTGETFCRGQADCVSQVYRFSFANHLCKNTCAFQKFADCNRVGQNGSAKRGPDDFRHRMHALARRRVGCVQRIVRSQPAACNSTNQNHTAIRQRTKKYTNG